MRYQLMLPRFQLRTTFLVGAAIVASSLMFACARQESTRARLAATEALNCAPSEVNTVLLRETSKVREWGVACDFTYTRIHCTDAGCRRAEPKPPCMGNLTCFEENPETLAWELPSPARDSSHR